MYEFKNFSLEQADKQEGTSKIDNLKKFGKNTKLFNKLGSVSTIKRLTPLTHGGRDNIKSTLFEGALFDKEKGKYMFNSTQKQEDEAEQAQDADSSDEEEKMKNFFDQMPFWQMTAQKLESTTGKSNPIGEGQGAEKRKRKLAQNSQANSYNN